MRLELRHSFIFFFALLAIDFLVFVISKGESLYSLGETSTIGVLAIPAALYLLACYACGSAGLRLFDQTIPPKYSTKTGQLPWVLMIIVMLLVISVSGSTFFSIDALTRQHVFQDNPWIVRIVLITLPLAMIAIICAEPRQRIALFFFLAIFFSLTGSRIHVMALILAMITAHSNRKVRFRHFVLLGMLGMILLDFLATQRENVVQNGVLGADIIHLFSSGHYSTFDIQTLVMNSSNDLTLNPVYVLVAAMGPLRIMFDLDFFLSSSEFFTVTLDPNRYYNNRSLATVGLTGELYMLFGWFGALFIGVFTGFISLLKRFFERISNYNKQMDILLRSLGFLYLFLLLRADMWIFFVYLWLQLPVLLILAIYFARAKSQR